MRWIRYRTRGLLLFMTLVSVVLAITPSLYDRWIWNQFKPELVDFLNSASFDGTTDGDYVLSHRDGYFIIDNQPNKTPVIDTRSLPNEIGKTRIDSTEQALDYWRNCYLAAYGWKLW